MAGAEALKGEGHVVDKDPIRAMVAECGFVDAAVLEGCLAFVPIGLIAGGC